MSKKMLERKFITKEEINEYPLRQFEGRIHIIDTLKNIDEITYLLKKSDCLGFDTETRPSFRKGLRNTVALLQLSTETDAFLFRLNKVGLPAKLVDILSDEKILKVGLAVRDDISVLQKRRHFEPAGFIELQNYVKEFGIENFGAKALSALLLGFRISKNQQLSNWEANQLSYAQMKYAATDAWVSLLIFKKLEEIKKNNKKTLN